MKCPSCGAETREGSTFCPRCGAAIEPTSIREPRGISAAEKEPGGAVGEQHEEGEKLPIERSKTRTEIEKTDRANERGKNHKNKRAANSKGKHKRRILIAIAALILVGGVFALIYLTIIAPDQNEKGGEMITQEEYNEQVRVGNEADDMYWDIKANEGEEAATQKTLEWLKDQEIVVEAGSGKGCLWVEFTDGSGYVILTTEPM